MTKNGLKSDFYEGKNLFCHKKRYCFYGRIPSSSIQQAPIVQADFFHIIRRTWYTNNIHTYSSIDKVLGGFLS